MVEVMVMIMTVVVVTVEVVVKEKVVARKVKATKIPMTIMVGKNLRRQIRVYFLTIQDILR